jgi:DNA-binding SARP family transcriptional activator
MGRAVRIGVVGPLEVRVDGRVLQAKDVGSRKARTLLALLAVERPRPVSVDLVVDAVWPQAPPRRPVPDVATLVSRLRTTLGRDAVVGVRTAYRLGDDVGVDLCDARDLVADAESRTAADPPAALDAARRAVRALDRGGVLLDLPLAVWAEPARTLQGVLWRRAHHVAAAAALRAGEPRVAQDLAEAALRTDPYDEASCRLAMRAHHAAGEPARASAAFVRLRATLADDLGLDPSVQTRQLHVAILRDTRPASAVDVPGTAPVRPSRPFAAHIPTWAPAPRSRSWLVPADGFWFGDPGGTGHDGPMGPARPALDPGSHELRAVVDRLPPGERDVVRMRHIDRLSHAEIAARLGIPIGTVKSRAHRAHRRLQTWLPARTTISA